MGDVLPFIDLGNFFGEGIREYVVVVVGRLEVRMGWFMKSHSKPALKLSS